MVSEEYLVDVHVGRFLRSLRVFFLFFRILMGLRTVWLRKGNWLETEIKGEEEMDIALDMEMYAQFLKTPSSQERKV